MKLCLTLKWTKPSDKMLRMNLQYVKFGKRLLAILKTKKGYENEKLRVRTLYTKKKSWKVRFWIQKRKSVVIPNLKSRSQIAGAKWCLCLKKFNFVSTFRFQTLETTEPFLGFYNSKNLLALDLALKTCWRKIVDSKWHSVCFGQLFGDIEKKLESLSFENGK